MACSFFDVPGGYELTDFVQSYLFKTCFVMCAFYNDCHVALLFVSR